MNDRLGNAVSALLLQVEDAGDRRIRSAVDLSSRELAALVLVRNRKGCTVGWLHERLDLTQSGAVRLLDRLQELGLVSRSRDQGRREVALAVTPQGEDVVSRGVAARRRAVDAELAGLSDEDRGSLLTLVERALATRVRTQDEGDEACRLCDWRVCTPTCAVERSVRDTPVSSARPDDA
jgi:DNA-binding MarR family transcriptional regulator